jgi:serine/threonine protein kinase
MNAEKADTPSLATGTRYELLKELGRGGMGVVHLALAKGPLGFSKLVVLKMMRSQLIGDVESHRMFIEEARISARFSHPNIVQVHEVFEYNGTPTMVMEYLEGQPLAAILRGDGMPAPRNLLVYVLTKVLAGLGSAHDLRDFDGMPLNLVHRDISPHNIFVMFDGQVKILDFGIAKASDSDVETQAGLVKGKIRYVAPEQIRHLQLDRRVDLFGVGVMLWEILVGKRFWGAAPDDEVISRLLNKQLPSLPAEANVPSDLAAICMRAIAADRVERYATAGRLQRDLEDHLARQPDPVDADDLAVFMHYRFGVEQDSAHSLIESQVRLANAAASVSQDATRVLAGNGMAGQVVSRRGESPPAPPVTRPSVRAAQRRSRAITFVLVPAGIVLVALAVMTGVMAAGRANGSSAVAPAGAGAGESVAPTCEPGLKSCDGTCMSIDRPDRGCGGAACYPCEVPNATPRCNQLHRCDIAICHQGFDDCDGVGNNGCETNVRTDPDNCGACGRRCPPLPHAVRGCGDGCSIWRCEPGHRDCNGVVADGCEVSVLDDTANCGACGHACKGREQCRQRRCE